MAENLAGRLLSARYYHNQDNAQGSLVVVFRVDRQGESSMISSDPDNLVGNIIIANCNRLAAPATSQDMRGAAQILSAYAEHDWKTDVELVATSTHSSTGVVNFSIKQLTMPFPRSQPPMRLYCVS